MRLRHAVESVGELLSLLEDADEDNAPCLDEDEVEVFSAGLRRLSKWVARQREEDDE